MFKSQLLGAVLALGLVQSAQVFAAPNPPDLGTLSQSAFIMGPGNSTYPIHRSWREMSQFIKDVDGFNDMMTKIESIMCGGDTNRSVLLIGEPNNAYKYLFSRLANNPGGLCKDIWHAELNISKVESGHRYVGEVDEYWQNQVLKPVEGKDVILYLNSLEALVGIGSHANDETGIEREYVANIVGGRMRTIAFIDKYEYTNLIKSRNAYVAEAFAEKIVLPPVEKPLLDQIVRSYMRNLFPQLKLSTQVAEQLYRFSAYYQPNRGEPDRTMAVLSKMIRNNLGGGGGNEQTTVALNPVIETPNPYAGDSKLEFKIEVADALQIALVFDHFDTEKGYDLLTVFDGVTNTKLDTLEGPLGAHTTRFYSAKSLLLKFNSDASNNNKGFKISKVAVMKANSTQPARNLSLEDLRRAIMEVAQVPAWLMNRDYTVIRELQGKLDGDVVGVEDGKRDLVRLAKNGYITGRTDEKPIATVLLAGPTGTGKSYVAKRFADYMGFNLITFDMTSYKDPVSFRNFVEIVSRSLANNPYAVYLFEEIDKASIEVLDQLYFMMDEGVFYDNAQRPLFARGAFILMTTNAGSDLIIRERDNPKLPELVNEELQKHFRASFLNRYDAVSIFKPFTAAEFKQLAKTLVTKKIKKMNEFFNYQVQVQDAVYDYIAKYGASPKYGARPMERLVESVVATGIAEYQLQVGTLKEGDQVALNKAAGTHAFEIRVNGGQAFPYTVDSDNNGGFSSNEPFRFISNVNWQVKAPSLAKFLKSIREFED